MIGNRTKIKIVKNKIAPPFKEAEFDIMFGKGISKEGDILDLAVSINVVSKSGAWYAYNGDKIGQGRENAKIYLREHPDVMKEVEEKVRAHYTPVEEAEQEEASKTESSKVATSPDKDEKGSGGSSAGKTAKETKRAKTEV